MTATPIPFLPTICSTDHIFARSTPRWSVFWSNVYGPDEYGYPRPSAYDARLCASTIRPPLYRIRVIRK